MHPLLFMVSLFMVGHIAVPVARAQSFDCAPYLRKRIVPESVICQSPQLAALDLELAGLYENLMIRLHRSAANHLRNRQRAWLAARNTCGFNANCLVGMYRSRIQELASF